MPALLTHMILTMTIVSHCSYPHFTEGDIEAYVGNVDCTFSILIHSEAPVLMAPLLEGALVTHKGTMATEDISTLDRAQGLLKLQ